jgi:hypothetical protein
VLCGHQAVVVAVEGEQARVAVILFGGLREATVPLEGLVPREGDAAA